MSGRLTRLDLYELCVQNPARDARVLRAIHGGEPVTLAEDFSGTAAISREWCRATRGAHAIATDLDAEVVREAAGRSPRGLLRSGRLKIRRGDSLRSSVRADIIAALNYSICEVHDRAALVGYFARARRRLARAGCLVLDIYAGTDAYFTGRVSHPVRSPAGDRITHIWEQRTADPLTGRVVNALHFVVRTPPPPTPPTPPTATIPPNAPASATAPRGTRSSPASPARFVDAFVYDWRLWSIPELRDAMREGGFATTQVYSRFADATDAEGNLYIEPVVDAHELGDSFSCYVVAR